MSAVLTRPDPPPMLLKPGDIAIPVRVPAVRLVILDAFRWQDKELYVLEYRPPVVRKSGRK